MTAKQTERLRRRFQELGITPPPGCQHAIPLRVAGGSRRSRPIHGAAPAMTNSEALTAALNNRVRERSYLGLKPKKYEVDAFQDGWNAAIRYMRVEPALVDAAPELRGAALKTLAVLSGLTTEQFSRGGDKPARDALYAALEAAGVDFHNHPSHER